MTNWIFGAPGWKAEELSQSFNPLNGCVVVRVVLLHFAVFRKRSDLKI